MQMLSYEEIKNWFSEKENKQKIVYGVCFVLVFIVGFGTGKFDAHYQNSNLHSQTNYTTKQPNNPSPKPAGGQGNGGVVNGTSTISGCLIKGNINSKGVKIYHMPGGMYYKIVKPEQCFATEAEAQAAGFAKSSR